MMLGNVRSQPKLHIVCKVWVIGMWAAITNKAYDFSNQNRSYMYFQVWVIDITYISSLTVEHHSTLLVLYLHLDRVNKPWHIYCTCVWLPVFGNCNG